MVSKTVVREVGPNCTVSDIGYVRFGQQKIAVVEGSVEHNKTAGAERKVFQEGTNNLSEREVRAAVFSDTLVT